MITVSTISFLIGAMLGQRFRVVVLIPAAVIVLGLLAATGFFNAQTAWFTVLVTATTVTCLQVGYFTGIGIRLVLAAGLSRSSSTLDPAHAPARHAAPYKL